MFAFGRLLSSSRNMFRRNALTFKNYGESGKRYHVAAIPPRNKISNGEKFVMGALLSISMWTIPSWIMYHIPDYQQEDRNKYTGK